MEYTPYLFCVVVILLLSVFGIYIHNKYERLKHIIETSSWLIGNRVDLIKSTLYPDEYDTYDEYEISDMDLDLVYSFIESIEDTLNDMREDSML